MQEEDLKVLTFPGLFTPFSQNRPTTEGLWKFCWGVGWLRDATLPFEAGKFSEYRTLNGGARTSDMERTNVAIMNSGGIYSGVFS